MIRHCKRRQFLQLKLNCEGEGDGGGGGGTGDGNNQHGNNTQSNLTVDDNFWDNPIKEEPAANQQTVVVQQQEGGNNETNSFDEHVAGMDFLEGVDVNAGMTAISNNDTEAFTKMLQQVGQNAYRQSMVDGNTVVNKRIEAATDNIRTENAGVAETSKVIDQMHVAMPFTKQALHAPMAKAVLTKALQKEGATVEKALKAVNDYFVKLSDEVTKLNPKAPSSRPSASGFGGDAGNAGNDDAGESNDWVDFMTAGNQQSS